MTQTPVSPLVIDPNGEHINHEVSDADDAPDEFSDTDKGWSWMVLVASFGSFCLIGNTMYAVGIIHSTLLERFNESVTLTSWAGALHSALISAGGPLCSAFIDRYSCRVALVTSGLCYMIGYLGTAFAPNIEVALFTCGIIAGLGGAFGYTASMVVIGFNFHKRRNMVQGIAQSGVGIGLFVLAPLTQMSRDYYGYTGVFIILAGMSANIITFGVMCFPSKLEKHSQWQRRREAQRQLESVKNTCGASLRIYLNVARNRAVICLCVSMFAFCVGLFIVFLYLPSYSVYKGLSNMQTSYVISCSGATNVVARILAGILASFKRINEKVIFSTSIGILSLATFLFPLYSNSFTGHAVYSGIMGFFFGSAIVVNTGVLIQIVGVKYMAAAIGYQLFFGGIGTLVGPLFAGVMVDGGGTYDLSLVVAASFFMMATVASACVCCFSTSGTQSNHEIRIEATQNITV